MTGFRSLADPLHVDHSDEELLSRFQAGEAPAAGLLYDRHHRCLYAYALSLVRDPATAEDLVHETFLRVLEARPEKPIASAKAFLLATTRNLALDLLRSAARQTAHRPSLAKPSASPAVPSEDGLAEAALAALRELSQDQREGGGSPEV
jgi:RNA polymerase sigma factor (sigma-70 family)